MRGTLIQKILSNLDSKEFDQLSNLVTSRYSKAEYLEFCGFLRGNPYTEEDAIAILGVSKRKKNTILEQLGELLIEVFKGNSKSCTLESTLEIAKRLILTLENESAIAVLKPTMIAAIKTERYDLILHAWKLARMANHSFDFDCISAEVAATQLSRNSELALYFEMIPKARKIEGGIERKAALIDIRQSSLEVFKKGILSQKGLLTFLRIQAHTDNWIRDSNRWPDSQAAVVAQIEANPWICEDFEFEFAREQRTLSQMYWEVGDYDSFRIASAKLWTASFTTKKAHLEQIIHQFPFLFGVAIDSGDSKTGHDAIRKFHQIVEDGILNGSPKLLTQNYYYCTYFLIVDGQFDEARKCLAKLVRFSSKDFFSKHLMMVNILNAVLCVEERDLVDAQRILKNLAGSRQLNQISGSKQGIEFLRIYVKNGGINSHQSKSGSTNELNACLEKMVDQEILNYFNLDVWFQSKVENRPMLEIFKQRAVSEKAFSF